MVYKHELVGFYFKVSTSKKIPAFNISLPGISENVLSHLALGAQEGRLWNVLLAGQLSALLLTRPGTAALISLEMPGLS